MRVIAASLLFLLLALAAIVVMRSPYSYATQDRDHVSEPASVEHRTGTDDLGRDRTVRTAAAMLLCLAGAALASVLASALAVSIGIAAAFASPWVGKALLYTSDVALALPWLFLLLIVRSALPLNLQPVHSALLTFLLLGLLGWPAYTRANHARALSFRRAEWLMYGRALGLRPTQRLLSLLPHLRPLLLAQFLIYLPVCIVAEANLGALGLGVSVPLPSWGSLLLSLQSSAVLASTQWVYLPIALLVLVLLLLQTLASKERA